MADEHEVAASTPPQPSDGAGAEDSGREGRRPAQTLPLNSRRLTAPLMRQLAGGLGVPTTAPPGDLLTMIEARLTEDGREPLHTQVVLQDVVWVFRISLRDESGYFWRLSPESVRTRLLRIRLEVKTGQSQTQLLNCKWKLPYSRPN